ncbi:tRNA (adenosine(37)-N6)-threonylcarbamoyltransferase complex ATPase subunit type 1 TsaE [uncultured Microscilla sp.]|uniref:tRNA (adenosine(37)-N6)-threonylcarbamoyltransferase complex ATPase subunit type 1 TsaE n=1 Tax=uncultured Microscilla sp. TaxID=432653 RepID=UPI0026073137|nr:tRNA (adenosine(37)-N6)-threonylcarbamoyltransferase complex ATPase subunit type 1 TsaE [uncultured Microscilla sp.]
MQITYRELSELANVAKQIVQFANEQPKPAKIWVFDGEMGAGKTTLIKEIGRQMGIVDTIQSPTYSIVNEYQNVSGEAFYHFDFYRLKNETEALDMGYEEYFYDNSYCFIEWASKIPSLMPENYLKIAIILQSDYRIIELTQYE